MTVNEIVQFLKDKPYAKEMGAGKLSKWLNCSREDVYNAKQILKKSNKN